MLIALVTFLLFVGLGFWCAVLSDYICELRRWQGQTYTLVNNLRTATLLLAEEQKRLRDQVLPLSAEPGPFHSCERELWGDDYETEDDDG